MRTKRKPKYISEVKQIARQVDFDPHKKDLRDLVELPLRKACERLYDLNVPCFSSSANTENVKFGKTVEVAIQYDKLSDNNKKIADALVRERYAKLGSAHGEGHQFLTVIIPIMGNSTVRYAEKEAMKIVNRFEKQDLTWAKRYTPDEFVKISGYETLKGLSPEDMAKQGDAFYDKNSGLIYMDKEHYKKALRYEKRAKKRGGR